MYQAMLSQILAELPMHLLVFACGAFGYMATKWVNVHLPRAEMPPARVSAAVPYDDPQLHKGKEQVKEEESFTDKQGEKFEIPSLCEVKQDVDEEGKEEEEKQEEKVEEEEAAPPGEPEAAPTAAPQCEAAVTIASADPPEEEAPLSDR